MKSYLFVAAGLFVAISTLALDTNVAEAGRCCRARRSCGYNNGCNTGWQNGCATSACSVAPGGQLIAQPSPAAAPAVAPAPQAEEVAPPPPEAAPAPAPAPESAKIKPEGEAGNN